MIDLYDLPQPLPFFLKISAGQDPPSGNEDRLNTLSELFAEAQARLDQVLAELSAVASPVLEGVSGPSAEQFAAYVKQLREVLPALSDSLGQLSSMAREVAWQVEYAKYVIILQLIWMAEQFIEWASTLWGAAVIPVVEAAGRFAVQAIMKRLAMAVASGVGIQVGMDVLVQLYMLFKDHKPFDPKSTLAAAEGGALAGLGGALAAEGGHILVPKFAESTLGRMALGGAGGVVGSALTLPVMGGNPQDLGLAAASGALGGLFGGGHGGAHEHPHVDIPPLEGLKLPDLLKGSEPPATEHAVEHASGPAVPEPIKSGPPPPSPQPHPAPPTWHGLTAPEFAAAREVAPAVRVQTETAEVSRAHSFVALDPVSGRPKVTLDARTGLVSYDLRRIPAPDGVVRDHTVRVEFVPEPGVTPAQVEQVKTAYRAAVNEVLNHGGSLPGGDLFHYTVEFTGAAEAGPPHQVVRLTADPTAIPAQNRWPVDITPREIGHEAMHGLGAMHSDHGPGDLMTAAEPLRDGSGLLPEHLAAVERVAGSQVVIPDPGLGAQAGHPSVQQQHAWYGGNDNTHIRTLSAPARGGPVDSRGGALGAPAVRSPAPWYVLGGKDSVRALGDMDVMGVGRPADAAAQARAAVGALRAAPAAPAAGGGRPAAGPLLAPKLGERVTHEITQALGNTDTKQWDRLLRSGLTVSDSTSVVRVRFRLDGDTAAPPRPAGDGVLNESRSKYGDVSYQEANTREQITGRGVVGEFIQGLTGFASSVVPSIRVGWQNTRISGHGIADELQSGSRATNSGRNLIQHSLRLQIEARTPDGRTATVDHAVRDMTVTSAHARAYTHDTPGGGAPPPVAVRNPAGVEHADYTIGAVDTTPLERDFLRSALESGAVAPRNAERFMHAMMTEVIDEKSVRDRFPYISSHAYSSNFIKVPGVRGYVRLDSKLVEVQRIGTADEGGVRNDIAETGTVKNTTGHGQSTSFQVGAEIGFPTATAGARLTAGFASRHTTASGVQGQAKTAIVHNGPQARFRVRLRVDGELQADPHLAVSLAAGRVRSAPVVPFGADLHAEILVPKHQAEAFLHALTSDPPPERPTPAESPRAPRPMRVVRHEVPGFPRGPGRGAPADPFAPWKNRAPSTRELIGHFGGLQGPVSLTVPHGHTFSYAEKLRLAHLQRAGDVRVFEAVGPNGERPTRLSFTRAPAEPAKEGAPGDAPLRATVAAPHPTVAAPHGTVAPPHRTVAPPYPTVLRAHATPQDLSATAIRHGFVVDERGVSHGWTSDGRSVTGRPAPGRTGAVAGPGPERPPAPIRTVRDLQALRASEERPDIAVVTGPDAVRAPSARLALAALRDRKDLDVTVLDESPSRLLEHGRALPKEGYVVNPAGRVVWGWRPAEGHAWGTDGAPSHGAATDLLREAGRGGLQLVIHPDGPAAQALRAAAEDVRGLGPRARLELQSRFTEAAAHDGAGLGALGRDDLVRMLVSDRNVRIVDGHGMVLRDLNVRGTFAVRPWEGADAHGAAHDLLGEEFVLRDGGRLARIVMTRPEAADSARLVREEYTLRRDGELSRSVSLRADGTVAGHARRAIHEADPVTETPELAGRVGLGSAATKELPGAERIHAEVRSLVRDLADARHFRPRRSDPAAGRAGAGPANAHVRGRLRRDMLGAFERFQGDKRLQTQFSLPRIRAARARGFDAGLREKFTLGGRVYEVRVEQVLLGRDHAAPVRTEPGVAIDHQTKGTRSGNQDVTRSWSLGLEAGAAGRVETDALGVSIEVGDFGVEVGRSSAGHLQIADAGKGYSRLRGPNADAARPEYAARYQVTVTETRSTLIGTAKRTVSRLIEGDEVVVPAIVHPAFRPDARTAAAPEFRSAFNDVAGTVGRTTVLDRREFRDLLKSPDRLDFSLTGTDGLHATFSGLSQSVHTAAELVLAHAHGERGDQTPAGADRAYVAEVEKTITEGVLRSNLDRLLSRDGIQIPLPREHHLSPLRANVDSSLTVRGYLVRADDAASFGAPKATVENYSETDLKVSRDDTVTWEAGLRGAVGPLARFDLAQSGPGGTEHGGAAGTRRALTSRVGGAAEAEISAKLWSKTESKTHGSIDVSLLTETTGQSMSRAHLVLEFTSTRQPVDPPVAARILDLATGSRDRTGRCLASARVLIENGAELSMSSTLGHDLQHAGDPGYLQPPPRAEQPRHIVRADAAWGAGYVTRFDDRTVAFSGRAPDGIPFPVPAGHGVIGAIKEGLRQTGLVGHEHLGDASDVWRALSAKFSAEELKRHAHDLLDVGMVHRIELPAFGGRTQRVTVRVRAEQSGFEHVRERDRGAVTLGGQALTQEATTHHSGVKIGGGVTVGGQYSADHTSQLDAGLSARIEHETGDSVGDVAVIRDIRRAAAQVRKAGDPPPNAAPPPNAKPGPQPHDRTAGEGEEFRNALRLRIEIYADALSPEPFRRLPDGLVSGPPRPLVTLDSKARDYSRQQGEITVRSVVPRNFTEDGPPPLTGRLPTQPPRPAGPLTPRVAVVQKPEARPGMLEYELGAKLQPIVFPDLRRVAQWAPAATLGRYEAARIVARDAAADAGPRVAAFDPTTDRGVLMDAVLATRNVRDNVRSVFEHDFPLPSTGSEPMRLGVKVDVIRPVGPRAGYNGLTFTERADEPSFGHDSSTTVSGALNIAGGDTLGNAAPAMAEPAAERGTAAEASSGDYVEYNRQFSGASYTYGGDFRYLVSGPRDFALRVDSGRAFEGLLPEGWAVGLAERFPTQVVHPHAIDLPRDAARRDAAVAAIIRGSGAPPAQRNPLRLVGDLVDVNDRGAFADTARDLAARLGAPVDLAVVHYTDGRATRVEHLVFDPAEPAHGDVARTTADHRAVQKQTAPGPDHARAVAEAQRAADASRESSNVAASHAGEELAAAAEQRSPLTAAAGHEEVVAQAWQSTRSGHALVQDDTELAAAQRLPVFPSAKTIAVGAPGPDGYVLRGRTLSVDDLAAQIDRRLTADGAQPPRRLIVHGSASANLARVLSTRLAAHGVDIIGAHDVPPHPDAPESGWGRWVQSAADQFSSTPTTGWSAYRDGRPIDLGRLGPRTDLADVVSALSKPLPHVPDHPRPVAQVADTPAVQRFAVAGGGTPEFEYHADGTIKLADGTRLSPSGWVARGDAFVQQATGYVLRRDGWISAGTPDAVPPGPDGPTYELHGDWFGLYLTDTGGQDKVHISLSASVVHTDGPRQ